MKMCQTLYASALNFMTHSGEKAAKEGIFFKLSHKKHLKSTESGLNRVPAFKHDFPDLF